MGLKGVLFRSGVFNPPNTPPPLGTRMCQKIQNRAGTSRVKGGGGGGGGEGGGGGGGTPTLFFPERHLR